MNAVEQATLALLQARRDNVPAPSLAVPLPDALAAYAVQDAVGAALGWFGDAAPRYWKSGGPSRGAQKTHAPLPPAGVVRGGAQAPADGRAWPLQLRGIEAEIALRLARTVNRNDAMSLTIDDGAELIDAMCVAIEIVDSRWAQALEAPTFSKLADQQSHGALVLGEWVPYVPRDWSQQECRVRLGQRPAADFRGTHTLGDPAQVLAEWLRHATRHGAELAAGTVVTTGTWNGLDMASAGGRVVVEFPGIGNVAVQF